MQFQRSLPEADVLSGAKFKMEQLPSKEEFLRVTREKYYRAVKEAKPLVCYFSITEACNLRCKYCGSNSTVPWEDELATSEIYDIIDNIQEAGTTDLLLAGGEPTMRKDLHQIVAYASSRMKVAINTNGHLLSKEYVWQLRRTGAAEVKVSLDGLEKAHDANRGKGSFKKAIEALRNCRALDIPFVEMAVTISRLNYADLSGLVDLALELGIGIIV